jgi:hypothetical protein
MWLKPKIIDSALLARGLTMFTGFISTLVTSKTIISAFGTDGFQIYGIWLALATFGGLIEIGRFSQQMYIINNPVLEMNVRVALLKKLYKRVGADCLAISILIISFIVWKIDRNPLLLTTMILAAFLSLFSQFVLKERIARGYQISFILLSAVTQITTPILLSLAINLKFSEENCFIILFTSYALINSITAFHSFHRINGYAIHKVKDTFSLTEQHFSSKWFFAVTVGLGLLSNWDRIWASSILSSEQFAEFAIIQVFILSSLNLLSIEYHRLWRQTASNQKTILFRELQRSIVQGTLLSFIVLAAIMITSRVIFDAPLNVLVYGFIGFLIILGTSIQNVFSAKISTVQGFRAQAVIIAFAVVLRMMILICSYRNSALTSMDLLFSSAATLLLIQIPFTALAGKLFKL